VLGNLLKTFIFISDTLFWTLPFSFLRMGTTGVTAQALGQKDYSKLINTFFQALLLALVLGFFIIILQTPLVKLSFKMIEMSPEVKMLAQRYYDIRIWAAPATLGLYAIIGWFFGMQNTLLPMALMVFTNIINASLSIYFVSHLNLSVKGIALGTVIAQYSGLLIGLFFLTTRYKSFFIHLRYKVVFEFNAFKTFITLNSDIFIRTLSLMLAFIFFNNQSSLQGDLVLAGNGILIQLIIWMAFGIDGFAYTAEALVGKYVGANSFKQVKRAIKLCFIWATCVSLIYSLSYLILGKNILFIFTNQPDVLEQAIPFLPWLVLFPLVSTPCYIWDGIYIGYVASKLLRNNMIISVLVYLMFFYGQDYFFKLGNHGLWLSIIVFNTFRGFLQWHVFKKRIIT
jgi:MATE family multidrug resistance protein